MARKKFTASFADGFVKKRTSERTYSHAWRVDYIRHGAAEGTKPSTITGFSGSRELAYAATNSETNAFVRHGSYKVLGSEVVAVVQS